MMLTALVQTKSGTLVVDLPRDRIDLEMKIRSVGIERLSDQIRIIDDEEKSDISVKLFGESDIGRHLSLIFNENHTLFDVNKTLQFVANSVEDIRDDLEVNIVHDQYDTPAELVGDIERMTDEVGQFTETFYFPLVGNMEDDEDGEQYEVGNKYMVDNSQIVIAVWNGKPSGTGNTVKYAQEQGKTVFIIDPQTLETKIVTIQHPTPKT